MVSPCLAEFDIAESFGMSSFESTRGGLSWRTSSPVELRVIDPIYNIRMAIRKLGREKEDGILRIGMI